MSRTLLRPGRNGETGTITLTAVVIVPVVIVVLLSVVQFALAWYAQTALNAAAEDGLRAAQTLNPDPAAAATASATGNAGFVSGLAINVTEPEPGTVRVDVSGRVPAAFPGLVWTLHADATGLVERVRPQGDL